MQLKSNIEIIKSPLNFTGGKYKLLPQLIPLFPDNVETFVDIFCGGCNVALNITANKIICNDIDSNLIGMFSFFKGKTYNALAPKIKEIINDFDLSDTCELGYSHYGCSSNNGLAAVNKAGYLNLRDFFNALSKDNDSYYLYLYVLIVYAFNNQIRFNSDGNFNLPVGKRDFNLKMQEKLKKFLAELEHKNIFFSNDCFSVFPADSLSQNDFVYADPPYLITCATYNEKSWNEQEEKKLLVYLDRLNERGIRFALSNVLSTDDKVNLILQDWLGKRAYKCHHLVFSYKNSNYQKKKKSETDEVLITNY
ncbi:DNA adenine methylase [Succinimonas amylolytica]|uniref:DNA adenine methylase n=1 Tax=Succinimonas amylolytica TaxID=83769 RepID=UPI00035C37D7|nr:DNA adenine methylase [Succinimonas amylolytica]